MPTRAGATHQWQNEMPHGEIHRRDEADFHLERFPFTFVHRKRSKLLFGRIFRVAK
jgi:hypothetical protein